MKAFILKWFGVIGEFLVALFRGTLRKELEVILPIVYGLVDEVARDAWYANSTGTIKREVVWTRLQQRFYEAQVQVAASTVNLAIELAVQRLKERDE